MSRKRRDNSGGRVPFSDNWIQSQANRIKILSDKDRRTYNSVEEKQKWMIDILTQRRDKEVEKCKLRRIAKEMDEIKAQLLEKVNKYTKIEREGIVIGTYEQDMLTLKSIKNLLEKI